MKRKQLMQFARMVQTEDKAWPLEQWLDENVLRDTTKQKEIYPPYQVGTWAYYAHKFQRFLDTGRPQFSLFTDGNKKLSFKKTHQINYLQQTLLF